VTGVLDSVQLRLVDNMAALDDCRRFVGQRRSGPLAFDTESAGLSPERDRSRMIQLGDLTAGWAFPADGWGGAALELLAGYPGELVAFNSPYDYRVLHCNHGVDLPWERIHDAQLAGHLADNLRPGGLKPRAALEVDSRAVAGEQALQDGMRRQGWTWATVPLAFEPYWVYAALDTPLTAHLWDRFLPAVRQYRAAYDVERAYARLCANMMTAGMMIDVPFVQQKIEQISRYCERARGWLRSQYGISSVESNEQVGRALNQAGVPTLTVTATGMPSISKDTLKLYASMFPHAADLIQAIAWCRKGESITGRYLEKFLALRDSGDVIHYSIHSCIARTSRSSVTDPPMQTYDRDEPVIRGAYVPRPGHVFISIDADQIEMRITAHVSGDRQMIADFHEADQAGTGFFIIAASRIYQEQIAKKDPRYTMAKNASYGQVYGAGLERSAATAGVPVEQIRPVYTGFQQRYPGVGRLMNQLIREGRSNGRPAVQSITGRRLYAYRGKEYALLNTKVQCSAAEILKYGGIQLDAAGLGPYLRLPVHDEWLLEVPAAEAQDVLHTVETILTDRDNFAVPLTWSGTILPDRWRKT
jgi:DNA polymerase-1